MRSTPSSPSSVPLQAKIAQNWHLLRSYQRGDQKANDIDAVFADIDEYETMADRFGCRPLDSSTVLEIGFGTRPYRLMALQQRGVAATGVDMEVPLISGSVAEYRRILRTNGVERLAKTFVRRTFFDRSERAEFRRRAGERGWDRPIDPRGFVVGDAADLRLDAGSLDLVVSEDVFEHVAPDSLTRLVARMATWLKPSGVALIRPNVFTGITGGHLIEWDRWSYARPPAHRRSEPWEHLRQQRFTANSYLNRLRLDDYRREFSRHFEIRDERPKFPDLGREFLTPQVRADLPDHSKEELMSNQVLFVLSPRAA